VLNILATMLKIQLFLEFCKKGGGAKTMVLLPSSYAPVPVKNKMVLISTEKKFVQLRHCEKKPELNK
jgi:hypothetical protein